MREFKKDSYASVRALLDIVPAGEPYVVEYSDEERKSRSGGFGYWVNIVCARSRDGRKVSQCNIWDVSTRNLQYEDAISSAFKRGIQHCRDTIQDTLDKM